MLGEIYRVTMIGHRIVGDFDIEEKLYDLFKNMLRTKEYVEFYLGRNGDFDILAASVIKRLQKNYRNDNSALILVLPYPVKDYEYYEKYYDEMAVLLLASISETIAYIQVHSHISNSFTVAKLSIELNETFDGKDKTNVTVENTEINGVFGEMTFVGGVATFVLKHGESKTATGLPSGITYSVTEAEANRDGYTTVASKASGSIIKNDTVTVAFTNTKNSNISEGSDHPNVPSKPSTPTNSPETGDTLNLRLWTSVMGVSLAGLIISLVVVKKNSYRGKRMK